tara:strand:+ start:25088 stop:25726 length:639 start_codon:yes stop_codon:yes gene_type:complete
MSRKKSKSKKDKPAYDENGHWIEERGRIKGAIRRCFRLSPQMREVLKEARVELPPALKKNGEPGKRPQVRYRCAICDGLFMAKNVQVDHIETVVPLYKTESEMPFGEWIETIARGIMCKKDNLQVACSTPLKRNNGKDSCHRKKTNEENFLRKKLQIDGTLSIEKLKEDFQQHLIDKENEKIAKEQRKVEREAKREAKRLEREAKLKAKENK